MQFFIKITQLC